MRIRFSARATALAGALALTGGLGLAPTAGAGVHDQEAHPSFGPGSQRITNPYSPISKFRRCTLAGKDDGTHVRIVRVLQHRTRTLPYRGEGVKTAKVIDRVIDTERGELIEKTADYFAQDQAGGVHYFGEHVDEYEHGHLTGHEGQWLIGRDTKRPGLLMPAHPHVGDHFRSEIVPGIAVEKDRVLARFHKKRVRGHTYHHVIRVHEHATTPKPDEVEYKTYSRGVGVITEADNSVGLVGCK